MPHYRRIYIPGSWYFFTVVTHERRHILCSEVARSSLRIAVEKTRAKHPFETIAWVLLPDHLHCIWQMPDGESDFSTRWRLIKSRFTKEYMAATGVPPTPRSRSRERHGEHAIWQRRFWERCLRDEEDLNDHIGYVHRNPVKHGLVDDPLDWRYSTIHRAEYKDLDWGVASDRQEFVDSELGKAVGAKSRTHPTKFQSREA